MLALAALFVGAAAMLALAVAFPFSDEAPVALGAALIPVALGMAIGTLVLGGRLPRGALLAQAALAVLFNGVLVAEAATRAGAIGNAFAYLWLTVYVAIFFPRSAVAFSAFVAATYGAGLLLSGLPRMVGAWGAVAFGVLALAVALAHVSRVVRRNLYTDPLTGVLNRAGLEAAAAGAFARTRRRGETLTVAVLDLDAFKQVNDRTGHAAGDRVLSETAAAWRAGLRGDDHLARIGGDEFVVLLPATAPGAAEVVLDRLHATTPAPYSAGIAAWRDGEPLADTLRRADEQMYAAKARRETGSAA